MQYLNKNIWISFSFESLQYLKIEYVHCPAWRYTRQDTPTLKITIEYQNSPTCACWVCSCSAEVAERGSYRRKGVSVGTIHSNCFVKPYEAACRHVPYQITHTPPNISIMADLFQSDRLQPSRDCTSQPPQILHPLEHASTFTIENQKVLTVESVLTEV